MHGVDGAPVMRALLAFAAALLVVSPVSAQVFAPFKVTVASGGVACTYGVDCLCDTLGGRGTTCFDFEEPGYYDPSLSDGPIAYNTVDSQPNRGGASRWTLNFGTGDDKTIWRSSDGAYTHGSACPWPPGYTGCSGTKEYASAAQCALNGWGADCLDANASACMDIQRSGDFDDEIGSLTLTGGSGVTSDIGGGNQSFAERVPAGFGNTCGFLGGGLTFASPSVTEVGITQKMAFSSNAVASDALDTYIKFAEWGNGGSGWHTEYWFLGRSDNGYGGSDVFPFRPFMFVDDGGAGLAANCAAAIAGATVVVGETGVGVVCNGANNAIYFAADPAVYNQATDWPFGTWRCIRGHISGMNTTNLTVKAWLGETLVMHITGIDGTKLYNKSYSQLKFDNYSNQNNDNPSGTAQSFYRYNDDIVINPGGPPVACSAIGG